MYVCSKWGQGKMTRDFTFRLKYHARRNRGTNLAPCWFLFYGEGKICLFFGEGKLTQLDTVILKKKQIRWTWMYFRQ